MIIIRTLLLVVACASFAVIGFSGYQLWSIHLDNAQESQLHNRLMQYRPQMHQPIFEEHSAHETSSDVAPNGSTDDIFRTSIANKSVAELQAAHLDAVGWLTIPNTKIDYPFAQGDDNDTYLHLDLEQRLSKAGTLFIDYRNSRELTDFNTIIYGHHMRNGSMFGTLQRFNDLTFFETTSAGTLFLADKTYEIELFAFMVIPPNDLVIYSPVTTTGDAAVFLDYVKSAARYYRDIDIMANDRLLTLSTCNYEFDDARMVLIGRLTEIFL